MTPYRVKTKNLVESEKISDPIEILKLKLTTLFLNEIQNIPSKEICETTGLHRSDLSRIKSLNLERFSIERIITLLSKLGYKAQFDIKIESAS